MMKKIQIKAASDLQSGDFIYFRNAPHIRGYVHRVDGFAVTATIYDALRPEDKAVHTLAAFVLVPRIDYVERWETA